MNFENIEYLEEKSLYNYNETEYFTVKRTGNNTIFTFSSLFSDVLYTGNGRDINSAAVQFTAGYIIIKSGARGFFTIKGYTDSEIVCENTGDFLDICYKPFNEVNYNTADQSVVLNGLGVNYSKVNSLTEIRELLNGYSDLSFSIINETIDNTIALEDSIYPVKIAGVTPVVKTSFPSLEKDAGLIRYRDGSLVTLNDMHFIDIAGLEGESLLNEKLTMYHTIGFKHIMYSHQLSATIQNKTKRPLLKNSGTLLDYDTPGGRFKDVLSKLKKIVTAKNIGFITDFSSEMYNENDCLIIKASDTYKKLMLELRLYVLKGFKKISLEYTKSITTRKDLQYYLSVLFAVGYVFDSKLLHELLTGSFRIEFLDILKTRFNVSPYIDFLLETNRLFSLQLLHNNYTNGFFTGDSLYTGFVKKSIWGDFIIVPEGEYFCYFRKEIVACGKTKVSRNYRVYDILIKKNSIIPMKNMILMYPDENDLTFKSKSKEINFSCKAGKISIDYHNDKKENLNFCIVTNEMVIESISINGKNIPPVKKADLKYIILNNV